MDDNVRPNKENKILIVLMALSVVLANVWYWGFSSDNGILVEDTSLDTVVEVAEEISEDPSEEVAIEAEPEELIEEEEESDLPYVPYVEYTPEESNSPYYVDAGLIPGTMVAEYQFVEDSYFDDACFIGDSRCMGIFDYSVWRDADYFCDNGFCAYDYSKAKEIKRQSTGEKFTLDAAMRLRQYGKIYIMIGVNDCGYGNDTIFAENYDHMLSMIMAAQPNAKIFLLGNLHVSREAEENSVAFKNKNINAKNVVISRFADGKRIFYLDFNELFVDEEGYLKDELTFDGFHLYAEGYNQVMDYIREHGIN